MRTKLPLILCIFYSVTALAQPKFNTNGLFTFTGEVRIPSSFEIGPGQLTKKGTQFIVGLTDGDLEEQSNLTSNIYLIDPFHAEQPMIRMGLPNAPDSVRYYQCSASKNEAVLVYVVNPFGGWADNQLGIAEKQPDGSYSKARELKEVNDSLLSDAYPWISPDGLDLFFSRDFKLFHSSRTAAGAAFNTPEPVKFLGDIQLEIISCWLTPDQKSMFFIANNTIYRSTRKSADQPFSFPELYTQEFKDFYFIAGLSFTPKGKDMILYYSDETSQSIIRYHLKKGKAW